MKDNKPSEKEYKNYLDKAITEKSSTWPEFANSFLVKYFDGQSFVIWIFVSGFLIVLYGNYAIFYDTFVINNLLNVKEIIQLSSFIFLIALIALTFCKNLLNINLPFVNLSLRSKFKIPQKYSLTEWLAETQGPGGKKRELTIKNIVNFKKIHSGIQIINAGNGRWRAGFIFTTSNGKREYIFHSFQDKGSDNFNARVVEREPGVRELPNDIWKNNIGVESPHQFDMFVENENGTFSFYINDIPIGKYRVQVKKINNITLAAWSDAEPIVVLFKNVEALA